MARQVSIDPEARADNPVRDEERGDGTHADGDEVAGQGAPGSGEAADFMRMPGEKADEAIDLGPVPVDSYPPPTPSVPGKRDRHDALVHGGAINDADAPMPAIRGNKIERRDGPAPDPDAAHPTL